MNYYLDECGHTGDLIKEKYDFNYAEQRLFSLSAIGLTKKNHTHLSDFIRVKKEKYKIQGEELKSKNIVTNNIGFVIELFLELRSLNTPILIELVDKKYFTALNLSNYQIDPGYFISQKTKSNLELAFDITFKNSFAERLTFIEDTNALERYIDCCINPTETNLLNSFKSTQESILQYSTAFEYPELLIKSLNITIDDYKQIKKNEGERAVLRFLPFPDKLKSGKTIWLLPHISSLINIVIRLNKKYKRKTTDIHLIHDTQSQLDNILHGNINGLLGSEIIAPPVIGHDYIVNQIPHLTFKDSKQDIGIQIADILSGFIARYTLDRIYNKKRLTREYHFAASLIENIRTQNNNPVGVNYVLPSLYVMDRARPNVSPCYY